jgi:hypothetical protein
MASRSSGSSRSARTLTKYDKNGQWGPLYRFHRGETYLCGSCMRRMKAGEHDDGVPYHCQCCKVAVHSKCHTTDHHYKHVCLVVCLTCAEESLGVEG